MRIGHGLYGLDDETMNLFKETGAIVEFNMHSNLALNNIDGVGQLPIAKYLNEGVSVVLSSDGGGIYQSDAQQEALVARFAGVTNSGMKAIRQTEKQYLKIQDEYMKSKEEKPDAYEVDFDKMPQEASYINESRKIKAHKLAIEQKNHQKLHEKIDFSDKKREELFKEGHPVFISGSGTSIDYMDKKDRLEIYTALEVLMDSLDNKKSYFVTSGYKHGVEGLFHAMKKRKEKAPKVLAVLAKDTKFSNTDYKAVDAGLFLGKDKFYRSWHEMNYLNERKGSAVFFGGGSITNDQIQSAVNFDLDYYLLSGVNGSSASKALYDKKHSCRGAEELVKSFYKKNKQLFRQDFNLDRLPSYVKASRRRVDKAIVEKRKIEIKEVNKKHGKLDKNILTKMKNIGRI
jgi:hypothetical protein